MLARRKNLFRIAALVFLLALPIGLLAAPGGAAASTAAGTASLTRTTVTTSSLGTGSPTFTGPAATGCAGCDLLTGPTTVPSTASFALGSPAAQHAAQAAQADIKAAQAAAARLSPAQLARVRAAMAAYTAKSTKTSGPGLSIKNSARAGAAAAAIDPHAPHLLPFPEVTGKPGPDPAPPSVKCSVFSTNCDRISLSPAGAKGVKGLNAVDSATMPTNTIGDIEPSDQGLCAGNGYVVESNNIGEVLFFNTRLQRVSSVIPLDTLMGLTAKNWSSGGDVSCKYDYANGGHWIFTEFVSASSEASGGPFGGCFAGLANTCYEGIAVTKGDSPYGPYNVYYLNANYNQAEPGAPYLLNDFTKTAVSRDAFLLFYDEFPLVTPGLGGGYFNGAQEFAFSKAALEKGLPVTLASGKPNPRFNVAIENMGTLPTPDGTCASDNTYHQPGITCWYSVIPAMPPDPSQFDNSHGGSAFMLDTLDFYGSGDTRLAVFDWTGLSALNSRRCAACGGLQFGGQLMSGVNFYYDPGLLAPQKAGPIPLGDQCGPTGADLSVSPGNGAPAPASCPEGGIATNGDNFTQASQAQNKLWGAVSTEVSESFKGGASPENHMGAAYYVVNTAGFDHGGPFTLVGQGYVAPAHEDLSMPDLIAADHGPATMVFTLTGNGGPTGADNGGFYPSTAYGLTAPGNGGLLSGTIHVVDLGQSPQDGFTEYLFYPYPPGYFNQSRWGDYSQGVFDPQTGKVYFANEYIQYRNCTGSAFTNTLATCGGTRDYNANWGTSVNSVTP